MSIHRIYAVNAIGFLFLLSLFVVSQAVQADDANAKELYREALKDYNQSNYQASLEKLEEVELLLGKGNARISELTLRNYIKLEDYRKAKHESNKFYRFKASDALLQNVEALLIDIDRKMKESDSQAAAARQTRIREENTDKINAVYRQEKENINKGLEKERDQYRKLTSDYLTNIVERQSTQPKTELAQASVLSEKIEKKINKIVNSNTDNTKKVAQLLKINKVNPYEEALINFRISSILLDQNKKAEALPYLEKAVDSEQLSQEYNLNAIRNVSVILHELGRPEDSIDYLQKGLRFIDTNNAEALSDSQIKLFNSLAKTAYLVDDTSDSYVIPALIATRNVETLNSDVDDLILYYAADKDYYYTVIALLSARPASSLSDTNLYNLTRAYLNTSNYALAAKSLDRYYSRRPPSSSKEVLELVALYLEVSDYKRAAEIMQTYIEKNVLEKSADHYVMLAEYFDMAGDSLGAAQFAKKAAKISEKEGHYYLQAKSLYYVKEYNESINVLEGMLSSNKHSLTADSHLLLGYAYYETFQYKKAVSMFERCLESEKHKEIASKAIKHIRSDYL